MLVRCSLACARVRWAMGVLLTVRGASLVLARVRFAIGVGWVCLGVGGGVLPVEGVGGGVVWAGGGSCTGLHLGLK